MKVLSLWDLNEKYNLPFMSPFESITPLPIQDLYSFSNSGYDFLDKEAKKRVGLIVQPVKNIKKIIISFSIQV